MRHVAMMGASAARFRSLSLYFSCSCPLPPAFLCSKISNKSIMPGGRPKDSKNTSGHAAGGRREGAGRPKKVRFILLISPVVLITWNMFRQSLLLQLQHLVHFPAPAAALWLEIHIFLTNFSRSQSSKGNRSSS